MVNPSFQNFPATPYTGQMPVSPTFPGFPTQGMPGLGYPSQGPAMGNPLTNPASFGGNLPYSMGQAPMGTMPGGMAGYPSTGTSYPSVPKTGMTMPSSNVGYQMGYPGMGTSGMGTPGMSPSGMGAQGMGTPGMSPSGMGTSGMGTPGMGSSGMGTSGMGTPGMSSSGMGTSSMGTPGMSSSGMGTSGMGTPGMSSSGMGTSGMGPSGMQAPYGSGMMPTSSTGMPQSGIPFMTGTQSGMMPPTGSAGGMAHGNSGLMGPGLPYGETMPYPRSTGVSYQVPTQSKGTWTGSEKQSITLQSTPINPEAYGFPSADGFRWHTPSQEIADYNI